VAGSLALLAERPATTPRGAGIAPGTADAGLTAFGDGFAECARCGVCQDLRARLCEHDGGPLDVLRLPRELAGRYRLIRRLGRGGMGTVYEAADLSLERRVAVKVIREDMVGSTEAAERFRREARASASIAHPNVVTVFDFGVAARTRGFLVMELLRGETLRDLLRQRGRLEPPAALAILRPIAEAVEAAHQQQLVHRDLKPENVFLAARGKAGALPHVKVLDFGIARFLSAEESQTTTIVTDRPIGTLHYMGPEQLRGGQAERGWDLWALAVMAYEMLAGVLPFPSATAVDYQVAVLAARSQPMSLQMGHAFAGLDPFFYRALSVDPFVRPSTARALADGLSEALGPSAGIVPQ
jgi:serine/threonine protein kinase